MPIVTEDSEPEHVRNQEVGIEYIQQLALVSWVARLVQYVQTLYFHTLLLIPLGSY